MKKQHKNRENREEKEASKKINIFFSRKVYGLRSADLRILKDDGNEEKVKHKEVQGFVRIQVRR